MANKNSKTLFLIAAVILIAASITAMQFLLEKRERLSDNVGGSSLVKTVSAQEIYPLFKCPCCGKVISECSCPMAKERRTYLEGLADAGISKDKALLNYVKKYGIESFLDKEKEESFREKLESEAPADRAVISLSPDSYDFGDVSQKKGLAETSFEIKNKGKSDLIIKKIETSCGCTSASIVYQGKESPKFGMPGHGLNEKIKNFRITIAPGKSAELKVYYDPNVHKKFRGTAIRTISLFSNDPINFEKKVSIELNQVD